MPEYTKKIVYLSDAQYQELITNKSITVNGVTVNYDKNMIYMTPQNTPLYAEDLAEWAKASTKPNYTAVEVGALPSNTHIPTTTAELTNDAGFITSAAVPTKISDLTDDSGHYTKPTTGIPASDLSEEIVSTIDGKAPAIYCEKSGAIASFDDGAGDMPLKECTVNIEPVQDLHGYDNPWPAGSGKNKMPSAIPTTVIDNGVTYTVTNTGIISVKGTATADSQATLLLDSPFVIPSGDPKPKFCIGNTIGSSDVLFKFYNGDIQVDSWTCLPKNRVAEYSTMQGKTCDRYIIIVPSGKTVDMTISPMLVENSITDYTYSPYSNICPITGWTGVKVSKTGKNLLKNTAITRTYAGVTFTVNNDGSVSLSGTATASAWMRGTTTEQERSFIPAGTYHLSGGISSAIQLYIVGVYADGQNITNSTTPGGIYDSGSGKTITFPQDAYCTYQLQVNNGTDTTGIVIKPMLVSGSIATDYEPYQDETYDIIFPTEAGTVYGGTLDVVRGVLTVDRAKYTFDGTESWNQYSASNNTFRFRTDIDGIAIGEGINGTQIANWLKATTGDITSGNSSIITGNPASVTIMGNVNRIYVNATGIIETDSIESWKSYLASNNLDVVMMLKTPIAYTLTPQEIRTLLGENNIWADTGDTAVTYPADTKMFVEQNAPESPVQDVQVNGTSVVTDGVANVPIASVDVFGATKIARGKGLYKASDNGIGLYPATDAQVKQGNDNAFALTSNKTHEIAFCGLAKAAGADMKDIANTTVGTYPDAQKEAIQSMLGITQMLAPENPNLVASQAYSIGDVFAANGHLYKATVAIAQDEAIIPDTNCVETTMVDAGGKIKDVQVNGVSIVQNGVANVPKAAYEVFGVAKINAGLGVDISNNGELRTYFAEAAQIKPGTNYYRPITPYTQHTSAFYGLAKAAGSDEKDSTLPVGQYTDNAKIAIKTMLGVQDGLKVVRLI